MVISKKPLQIILAVAMAFMPFVTTANPTNDSTKVEAHAAPKATEVAHEQGHGHAAPTDIKSQVKAFTKHHVLDAHDFYLFSDNKEGKHYASFFFFKISSR
jgi:F-type H+-transporting ATPase subunit a